MFSPVKKGMDKKERKYRLGWGNMITAPEPFTHAYTHARIHHWPLGYFLSSKSKINDGGKQTLKCREGRGVKQKHERQGRSEKPEKNHIFLFLSQNKN